MKTAHAKAAQEALSKIGTTTEAAAKLGVEPNVVTNWKTRGIPARWAQKVAKLAKMRVEDVCPAMVRA